MAATGVIPAPVAHVLAAERRRTAMPSPWSMKSPDASSRACIRQLQLHEGLITTFAALDILGPADSIPARCRKERSCRATSSFKGGGDPDRTWSAGRSFVQHARAKGIKTIHGDIVIDDMAFALPP